MTKTQQAESKTPTCEKNVSPTADKANRRGGRHYTACGANSYVRETIRYDDGSHTEGYELCYDHSSHASVTHLYGGKLHREYRDELPLVIELGCGHDHPQTTGQCDYDTTKGGINGPKLCKINASEWDGYMAGSSMTWSERCARHRLPEAAYVTRYTFDECGTIFARSFMAKLDAETTPQEDTRDEIDAWLDSRAGLNGTMTYSDARASCAHCDTAFTPKATGRPAAYCSTRCRVAAHRAAKKVAG